MGRRGSWNCRFSFKSLSISSFQLKCWEGTDTAPSQDVLCKPIHANSPVAEAQERQSDKKKKKVTFTSLYICTSSMIFSCQRGLSVSCVRSASSDISFFSLLTSSEPYPMENLGSFHKSKLCRRKLWPLLMNFHELEITASLSIAPFIQGFTHELATELLEYFSGSNLRGSIEQRLPNL